MTGRNRDTTLGMIEKTIRTKAWYAFILNKSGHRNAHQLASVFDQGKRKWSDYANGSRAPQPNTLKRAEALYAGSLSTFNSGPKLSALFESMFTDLNDSESCRWLSTTQNELNSNELVVRLENILISKLFNKEPIEIYPDSPLHFLAGCSLLFRRAINNHGPFNDRNIHDLIDLILDFCESDELSKELDSLKIKSEFMRWLLFHALAWSSETTTYMADFFSDEPCFIDEDGRPQVTSTMILEVADSFLQCPRDFTNKLSKVIHFEEKHQRDFINCIPEEFKYQPLNYGLANQERLKVT